MNKAFVFFYLLLFLSFQIQAQEINTIFGYVTITPSDAPLEFVSVVIDDDQSGAITIGTLTDETGYFEISGLPVGDHGISFSLAGYLPQSRNVLIFDGNSNYDLGTIVMSPSNQIIEELIITGQQNNADPTLDSRIFNLDDNIAQSNGSLLDVMRTMPGVTVEQDGRIQLRGSDRVVILIDGQQSSLTGFGNQAGLDSIPANGIATIEIINNPSSRFDATGMAGVINITYKENRQQGFTGDAGLSLGVGQLSKRKDDLPTELGSFSSNSKVTPSLNLNYNTDDKRFFLLSQILIQDDLPNNEFTTRYYDDGRITFSQVPENREQVQYIINGGVDWNINDNNLLTLSSIIDFETHEDNAQVPFINGSDGQRYRYWFWKEEEDTGFLNLNANLEHRFDEPGHEITGFIQYTRGWEYEDYFLNDRSALRNASDSTHLKATEHTLPIQIDYVKPLSAGRMELGAKYQKRWIPVTYDVVRGTDSIIYNGLGDWSEWGETTSAVYANLVYETLNYGIEGGVRLEQTDVYYDIPPENIYYPGNDNYDYFKAYPNFRVSRTLNDSSRIAMYYASRVDRPGEAELRIFPKYDDPELLKVGNPYLRPQFTDSVELAYEYLWDSGSMIASIYHRDIDDPFMRVFDIDNSDANYNIVNRIYQNVGSASNKGLELIFSQDVSAFWQFSGSVNWFENTIDQFDTQILFPTVRPFSIDASSEDTWTFNMSNQFALPYLIQMQLSFTYYDDRNFAQGTELARSSVDLGLSKYIFGETTELVFAITDLFNKFGIKQEIDGAGFNAVYENYFESQVVSVGLNYNF